MGLWYLYDYTLIEVHHSLVQTFTLVKVHIIKLIWRKQTDPEKLFGECVKAIHANPPSCNLCAQFKMKFNAKIVVTQ